MYQIQPTRPTKVRSTLRSLTSRLRARDTTVALDDTLAFTVTIENTGDAKGVQTVEFRIGDNAVASRKVTLDVNNSTTIEFDEINVSHFDTGEYEYGFLTNDDNRTVTITFQPAGDDRVVVDRDNDTDSENDSNGSDGNDERDGATSNDTPGFGASVCGSRCFVVATLFMTRPSE